MPSSFPMSPLDPVTWGLRTAACSDARRRVEATPLYLVVGAHFWEGAGSRSDLEGCQDMLCPWGREARWEDTGRRADWVEGCAGRVWGQDTRGLAGPGSALGGVGDMAVERTEKGMCCPISGCPNSSKIRPWISVLFCFVGICFCFRFGTRI